MDSKIMATSNSGNYDSGFPNHHHHPHHHMKNTQVFKRKHVSTVDDDYDSRLLPAPPSIKADGTSQQPFKSVQMSMNSINMERTQRIQESGAEYMVAKSGNKQ